MKIKKGFSLRRVMGRPMVLAEGNNVDVFGKLLTLNDSGAQLWSQLVGRDFEVADAAAYLVDAYGIDPAQAREDAERFVALLSDKGLIDA